MEMSTDRETQAHLRTLVRLSILGRVLVAALVISSTYLLPLFDSSPRLVLSNTTPPWISSLLRWDAFHFLHVAQQGHVYEHTWAFFPALPLFMRLSGHVLSLANLFSDPTAAPLLGGAVLSVLFDPTRTLYRLSLHHLGSPSAAFLASALSLLSSSPAVLRFAPYSEPMFTYCSYKGMWACARGRWVGAAVWFGLASAFRSNGVLLAGFVVWGMVVEPWVVRRKRDVVTPARILYCLVLVAIPFAPFAYHNYTGYVRFCTAATPPEWCDQRGWGLVPSIYAHVQRRYWNVGFMRYWTVSNVPNVVLALPVLMHVYAFCAAYLVRMARAWRLRLRLQRCWTGPGKGQEGSVRSTETCAGSDLDPPSLFFGPSLLPHVLHALALTLLLTFNAHVQIALRVLPSLPVVYWAAARLLVECPGWGKAWIAWSIVWGAVSCVLWGVFLPPA